MDTSCDGDAPYRTKNRVLSPQAQPTCCTNTVLSSSVVDEIRHPSQLIQSTRSTKIKSSYVVLLTTNNNNHSHVSPSPGQTNSSLMSTVFIDNKWGQSKILWVSENVSPLLYCGFSCFTRDIVDLSDVRGKSWCTSAQRTSSEQPERAWD